MRTIIIGDIHGCYQELVKLLEKTAFNKGADRLISLGDLMDRGRQSYEVFDFFRHLKAETEDHCIIIRGNHEDMMMNTALYPEDSILWEINGGDKTIQSFCRHNANVYHYAAWFNEHTVLSYEDNNFQCCHAGLINENIAVNLPDVLLWDRSRIDRNDYCGKLTIIGHTPSMDAAWYAGDKKTVEILPEHRWMPLPKTGLICLDTGCVFGFKLTAMIIEGTKYRLESVFLETDNEKKRTPK